MWKLTAVLLGLNINAPADLRLPDKAEYDTLGLCMNAAAEYALKVERVSEKNKGSLEMKCEFKHSNLISVTPGGWIGR